MLAILVPTFTIFPMRYSIKRKFAAEILFLRIVLVIGLSSPILAYRYFICVVNHHGKVQKLNSLIIGFAQRWEQRHPNVQLMDLDVLYRVDQARQPHIGFSHNATREVFDIAWLRGPSRPRLVTVYEHIANPVLRRRLIALCPRENEE